MNNKITLKMNDCCLDNKELQRYLLSLKEIKKINSNSEKITIEYTKNISPQMIINKIKKFTKTSNIPSLYYFNKHLEEDNGKYERYLNDLCCEYCLYSFIENLLSINGINKVYINNEETFKIVINYNKNIMNETELEKLIKGI